MQFYFVRKKHRGSKERMGMEVRLARLYIRNVCSSLLPTPNDRKDNRGGKGEKERGNRVELVMLGVFFFLFSP